jgi:hypothetical protein
MITSYRPLTNGFFPWRATGMQRAQTGSPSCRVDALAALLQGGGPAPPDSEPGQPSEHQPGSKVSAGRRFGPVSTPYANIDKAGGSASHRSLPRMPKSALFDKVP